MPDNNPTNSAQDHTEEVFAHLHLHSEYSLLDGGNRVEKLVARVKALGMKAVAVTDHGNIFGAVHFYLAAKDAGIKPILGVEAYVTPPGKPRTDRTYSGGGEGGFHLVLLAENNAGWQNLLVLCSEAYLTGFYYKPRIDRELLAKHADGLIAINGHLGSEIGDHLLAFHRSQDPKHWLAAVESARWHAATFKPDSQGRPRFFVEMQRHVPEQNAINPLLIKLARELNLPLIADNDAHFLHEEDHDAHDTLICISTGKGKNADNRMRYPRDLYVKSPEQMRELFEEYGEAGSEAIRNAALVAGRCQVDLPLGESNAPAVQIRLPEPGSLPDPRDPRFAGDLSAWYREYCGRFELVPFKTVPTAEELAQSKADCDTALRQLAEGGFIWRYGLDALPDAAKRAEDPRAARLERELKILADKNISAYFLIVWDFVNWGRQRGIPAAARGSGVGTMVGYVLGLSNACPVRYGLLFERFTDPDRSEYPDIDIDLCQDGRGEVIDYVRQKYGHVAQIITFGTLGAKAALRDVGRVLEIPLAEVDRLCKLIPAQLNITLPESLEQEPELKRAYEGNERYRQLIDTAIALEGHTRHAGVHAAGVIVATRPLQEIIPLYRPPGTDTNETITQWDGPTCEKMGLLKMDFLGLRTLSVIERAKKLIRETMSEREIWEAVGRGGEYEKWQSGKVAERHSEDQDLSRPLGVATRHGPHAGYLPGDGVDAEVGTLRPDQPNEAGGMLDPAQHRGGVRPLHQAGVRARAEAGLGIADGADDRVRTRDEHGPAEAIGRDRSAAERRGSPALRADSKAPHQVCSRPAEQPAEEVITSPLRHSATLPLDHSTTRPLLSHPLDLDRLSSDDQKVFELFRRGETTGVFQFESGGMRRLLVEMKPDRLEDLIAANALFRPGPMDLIPDYNRRKHGTEDVPKVHEIVDRYTDETYGVMVYQEQVMQIVHGLGGIKLRDAYTLIKNISKKKHDKIEKERPKFVAGAQKQGLSAKQAEDLFELILKFAGYGFNKSHSTGYAIVAYQTAYLKTYFPEHYMAAFLTYESGASKVSDWIPYLEDCRRTRIIEPATGETRRVGVEVRPPDINLSQADFAVVRGGEGQPSHVRFGLSALKGVGDKLTGAVIAERQAKGPFTSLIDLCERLPPGTLNKTALESLVTCGALDSLHGRAARASMLASVEAALSAGARLAADKAAGQSSLFGAPAPAPGKPAGPGEPAALPVKVPAWSEGETLRQEKEVLGFYLSSHPLERWRCWASAFASGTVAQTKQAAQDARVVVAAMVQSVRTLVLRSGRNAGQKMGILTVEDSSGTCDVVLFADAFAKYGHLAVNEATVFVLGRADHARGEPQIVVDRLVPIDGVPLDSGRLRLFVDEHRLNGHADEALVRVAELLRKPVPPKPEKGLEAAPPTFGVEVVLGLETQVAVMAADHTWRVPLSPDTLAAIESALGAGMVKVAGAIVDKPDKDKKPWQRRRGGDDDE